MSSRGSVRYISRRSCALATEGAVSCANPLAAQVGRDILKEGGNAADAAVAMAACLNVVEPTSTGAGGDAFCLYYDVTTRQVHGIDGSGAAPAACTLARMRADGFSEQHLPPTTHGLTVTVPGAVRTWADTRDWFGSGKLSLAELLAPAIRVAEVGFPVPQITSHFWRGGEEMFKDKRNISGATFLIDWHTPRWGEVFRNPDLAQTFKRIASDGPKGFYTGKVAQAIVDAVGRFGGVMSLEDLANHRSRKVQPIHVDYEGVRLWEIPPATQGIIALEALKILQHTKISEYAHNSADYLHTLMEALRIACADGFAHIGDPEMARVPIDTLISDARGAQRAALINQHSCVPPDQLAAPALRLRGGSDTTYLTAVDGQGNACSFINSNFMGFGTGIVADGCGFTLQNRGYLFRLEEGHPNSLAPGKRPYHTIIPAMLTDPGSGELLASYGVMGGFMQPQGHVQVLLNMKQFGFDPQTALDLPRFHVGDPGILWDASEVSVEEGIDEDVIQELKRRGHKVKWPIQGHGRSLFGRGFVITKGAWWSRADDVSTDRDVLWVGAEGRSDGTAAIL